MISAVLWILVLTVDARKAPSSHKVRLRGTKHADDLLTELNELSADLTTTNPKAIELNEVVQGQAEALTIGSLAEDCRDLSRFCTRYSKHCNHPNVKKFCRKTCNLCPGGLQLVCADRQRSESCANLKRHGYCNHQAYRSYVMENCKYTCRLCPHACGVAPLRRTSGGKEIVGGVSASKSFWPWQAALLYDNRFICGGTLIDAERVITAAHCFRYLTKDAQRYTVVLGEHNRDYSESECVTMCNELCNNYTEQTFKVKILRIHHGYNIGNDDDDISILILSAPAQVNDHVVPACLPSESEELKPGETCYVTGWGSTRLAGPSTALLQELELPIADPKLCAERNAFNLRQVTKKMICAGYSPGLSFASACHGDSGGPLVCLSKKSTWTLHGVVSWGSPRCDGFDRYSVFTKVSAYLDWIDD